VTIQNDSDPNIGQTDPRPIRPTWATGPSAWSRADTTPRTSTRWGSLALSFEPRGSSKWDAGRASLI